MLHGFLRNRNWTVNHKRFYRIYAEKGLQLRQRFKKKPYHGPRRPLAKPEKPDHTWAMDIVSQSVMNGRKVRILSIVDIFTREVKALFGDTSLPAFRIVRFLDELARETRLPEQIVMDNGPEFRSAEFGKWAKANHCEMAFIQPGKPMQNGFVESFHGKLRKELLNWNWFADRFELQRELDRYRKEFNTTRPHSSLKYLTPSKFRELFERENQVPETNI